jgi:hypothetical protein
LTPDTGSKPGLRSVATGAVIALTAALLTPTVAGATPTGTGLFAQSFTTDQILPANGDIVVPGAPTSSNNPTGKNFACLTVTQTLASPLPNCSPAPDASGSGALQLTNDNTHQEGGVFSATSVPASEGLDMVFDTYQYGGNGADGIAFVLAAVDPADPAAPTVIGQAGGSLGYSAQGSTLPGLEDGYLGLGLDAYGNFSNNAFQGLGCPTPEPAGFGALGKGEVVVRGPGNGSQGYCGLQSTNASPGLALDVPGATGTRANSQIPVEVIINTTAATVTATTDSTVSVLPGQYGIVFTPIGGTKKHLVGALPSVSPTFYGANTSSWLDTNGIPKQLAFGWVASTGGSKDTHEVNTVSIASINPVPKLDVAQTDQNSMSSAGSGTVAVGTPVTYTVGPSVDSTGAAETGPITVTDTLPAGVTPTSAGGVGWVCSPPSGQQISCTDSNGPFNAGTTLPALYVNGWVSAGGGVAESTIENSSVVTDSSDDGDPGYATATPLAAQPAITDATLAPSTGIASTAFTITSATDAAELAHAAEVDIDGTRLALCSGTVPIAGCFIYDAANHQLDLASLPAVTPGPVSVVVVADGTASTSPSTFTFTENPQITTSSLPVAELNVPYSQTLESAGAAGALTWTSGTLPAGLTFDPTTGVISGTPTAAGSTTFDTDFTDSASPPQTAPVQSLSITVVGSPSITTPSPLPDGQVGVAYSTPIATTGGIGPFTWAVTGGTLPAGLVLDTATGVVSGTPTTADSSGPSSFTLTATDVNAVATAPVTYTISVLAPVATVPVPPVVPVPPGSVDSQTASGTNPTATSSAPGSPSQTITASATGTGYLRVTTLGPDPVGVTTTDPAVAGPLTTFYSVAFSPGSSFSSVDVTIAGTQATSLFWWDGTSWQKVTGVTRDSAGDLVVRVTPTSGPSLSELNGATFAAGGLAVDRIAGSTRTGTAIAASQASYPVAGSAGAVVLARDDVFADALTGGPLAAAKNAPILLTDPSQLLAAVAAELARVLPAGGTVYLLGGDVALHESVATAVTAAGFHAVRVDGPDRYGTAVAIAGALGNPGTVFEATGLNFPDAVSAGPAAIKEHGAILLTNGSAQSPDSAAYIAAHHPTVKFAIGGAAAAADPSAIGLVGADRYGTAAAVATTFFAGATRIGLATGDDFADPLVAAPSLGRSGSPLLLVADTLPAAVAAYLKAQAATIVSATFYGGPSALPAAVMTEVQQDAP